MHTPGPWGYHVIGHSREILRPAGTEVLIGSDDTWVCAMYPGIGGDDEATDEANARLIAAAPDLLAALIRARECIEDAVGESDGWQIFDEIDAAIAKATGEGARNA